MTKKTKKPSADEQPDFVPLTVPPIGSLLLHGVGAGFMCGPLTPMPESNEKKQPTIRRDRAKEPTRP